MDTWELLGDRQLQVEIVPVVLEADVETRPVVLDEAVLQNKRLNLVGGGDEFEVRRLSHELGRLRGRRVARGEVRAESVAQAQRLADIDDLGLVVAEQVDAR